MQLTLLFSVLTTMFVVAGCSQNTENILLKESIRIHDIQGCSHKSPLAGQYVKDIPGIVTKKVNSGFYLQDEQPDDRNCTSEAIYIFVNSFPDVLPGDRVEVSGRVEEFQQGEMDDQNLTITEIVAHEVKIISHNNSLPEAIVIGSPKCGIPGDNIDDDGMTRFEPESDGLDFFESLESMLVQVNSGIVVGSRNEYNEVVIITPECLKGNYISESGALIQQKDDPNPERLILNLNDANTDRVNLGAKLNDSVLGIMDYSYGNFKLNIFGKVQFLESQPANIVIDNNNASLTIASYNVENLSRFDADSKFRALATEITKNLDSPDIVILQEILDDSGIEDDGTVSSMKTGTRLVETIEDVGDTSYSFIDNVPDNNEDGGINGGNIRSIILVREASGITLLDISQNPIIEQNPIRIGTNEWSFSATRKPLIALFEYKDRQFMIVAVHLTSRGADSPLFGNVQPIEKLEEEKRVAQAVYINEYLADFHSHFPSINIIVVGDVNDDPWSRTLEELEGNLLSNLGEKLPIEERYSYIMEGNAVELDYILVSTQTDISSSIEILHINTSFDYAKQVSDHDPVYARFIFNGEP